MVSLREQWSSEQQAEQMPAPGVQAAQWMTLRHASCRLDVCPSTLRRRIRRGDLPWRIVNHGRCWAYEVLVPNGTPPCAAHEGLLSIEAYLRRQLEAKEEEIARLEQDIRRLDRQIENLAQALARARAGDRHSLEESPFSEYRQMALRRRRWWPF